MKAKPTPDRDVLSALIETHRLSMRALVRCLEDNGALKPGQFAEALHLSMENSQDETDILALAMMHNLRRALVE